MNEVRVPVGQHVDVVSWCPYPTGMDILAYGGTARISLISRTNNANSVRSVQ